MFNQHFNQLFSQSLFNQLLSGQKASIGRLRQLLRMLTVGVVLCVGGTGYSLWSAQASLAAAHASARSLKTRTMQMSRTLQAKREQATLAAGLHMADPMGEGSMELSAEISRLARAAGVQVGDFRITPAAAAPAVVAANTPQAANPTGGAADAGAQKTSAPVPGSRWTQAKFDYEFTGTFHALITLLHDLASMPRIIEINALELARTPIGGPQGKMNVHLKLSGTLYGLPETPNSQ